VSIEPPPSPRSVKPRKPSFTPLFVIAVTDTDVMLERTGNVFPIEELPATIIAEPSSMIVAEKMGEHVLNLSREFEGSETFQYKLTPIYRDIHPINGEVKHRAVLRDTTCTLIGFIGKYHHPIDPQSFIRQSIDEIDPSNTPRLLKLIRWGREVRDFCLANDMKVKPSAGGLAAQLLRDPRFYPKARRKVPKIINAKGRSRLPGNFYELYGERRKPYSATYLDMQSAHHHIARTINFPCADTLHAYGHYTSEHRKRWVLPRTERMQQILKSYGLLHVQLSVPHLPPGVFVPPYMQRGHGLHDVWIFTNELPLVASLGAKIEGIYTALVSPDCDTGLAKYAEFAQAQLAQKHEAKAWLKPVLHSAYGVLAGRPRPIEIGWRIADGGVDDQYPMGGKVVPVKVCKTRREIEASVVNTIHRGMIEAEQRCMALRLAAELSRQGGNVICVYADSLFVAMPQLPLLPAPWVVKDELTDLQFLSATQFVSSQLTRLPGVTKRMEQTYGSTVAQTRTLNRHGLPTPTIDGSRIYRPRKLRVTSKRPAG